MTDASTAAAILVSCCGWLVHGGMVHQPESKQVSLYRLSTNISGPAFTIQLNASGAPLSMYCRLRFCLEATASNMFFALQCF